MLVVVHKAQLLLLHCTVVILFVVLAFIHYKYVESKPIFAFFRYLFHKGVFHVFGEKSYMFAKFMET